MIVLAFSAPTLCADRSAQRPVDARVVDVRTVGGWELEGRYGEYRIVIANIGYEHATSQIRFEWIDHSGGVEAPSRIARTEVLHDSLLGSIRLDALQADAKGVTVAFSGDLQDGSKYSCRVTLSPSGISSRSAGC